MRVQIESLIEGARRAEGVAVIIDVFRAFTTAAVAFSRGARQIVLVAGVVGSKRVGAASPALRLRAEVVARRGVPIAHHVHREEERLGGVTEIGHHLGRPVAGTPRNLDLDPLHARPPASRCVLPPLEVGSRHDETGTTGS